MGEQNSTHQSLPEQIAARIRAELLVGRHPDQLLPTVMQLAARYDVSKHTISTAIDILARVGLIVRRERRGIFVAPPRESLRIGILSELDLFDNRIGSSFRMLAGALNNKLEAMGSEPLIYIGNADPGAASDQPTCGRFWADVDAGRLDGAVILDVPSTQAWRDRVLACPMPVVGAMTEYGVNFDSAGIAEAAVRMLARRGCQRLGLLAWHNAEPFRNAVAKYGLVTRDAWIRTELDPGCRGAGWEEFREVWVSSGEKPDGLVILDDMLFVDAQLAIAELGVRVPEDLQLVVQVTRGAPPVTRLPIETIELDPEEHAGLMLDMLVQRIRGEATRDVDKRLSFHEGAMTPTVEGPGDEVSAGSSANMRLASRVVTASELGKVGENLPPVARRAT